MSSNILTIKYAKQQDTLYFCCFNCLFPNLITASSSTLATSISRHGFLSQGRDVDRFNNKSVVHQSFGGEINTLGQFSNCSYYEYFSDGFKLRRYYNIYGSKARNTIHYMSYSPASRNGVTVCEINTATYCRTLSYNSAGELMYKEENYLDKFLPNFSTLTCTMSYTKKRTVYEAGARRGYVSYTTNGGTAIVPLVPLGATSVPSDSDLFQIQQTLVGHMISPSKLPGTYVPSSLGEDILDNLPIPDVNNLENVKDIKRLKDLIPPLARVIKEHNIKSISDLYLWYKYSYSTTEMDIKEYIKVFNTSVHTLKSDRNIMSLRQQYFRPVVIGASKFLQKTTYKIYMNTFSASWFQTLGLKPTMSNIWDLLPYSFVADWIVNIGDLLKQLDSINDLSRLNIQSVLISDKYSNEISADSVYPRCYGILMNNYYHRYTTTSLPINPLTLSIKNPSRHMLDGAALVISNKK